MRRVMLIWNPAAGRGNAEMAVRDAARVLEEAGWGVRLERSQSAEHITALAQEAVRKGLDAVWVAGGDGSLGRAVTGLVGSSTALGVLPTGTANVWAKEIGLSLSGSNKVVESAQQLATGQVRAMDIGICNKRPFFLWAGFGLDGRVVDRLERNRTQWLKRWNEFYYLLTILQCSAGWKGTHLQIETGEQQLEGQFILTVAGNIQHYAGGAARLSPNALWDDGRMELWLFRGGEKGGLAMAVRYLWNLGWGRHGGDNGVVYLPFWQVKLTFATEEWMQLDGDPWGKLKEAKISVQTKALKVLVPGKGD